MKITDDLLYKHAAEARDIWLNTLPDESEIPEHQFSEEFEQRIQEMVYSQPQKKSKSKIMHRVAAVFVTLLIGSTTLLATNIKARAAFESWVRDMVGDSFVYRYSGEAPEESITYYLCSWLPEGVEASEVIASDTAGHVIYQSPEGDGGVFSYTYMHSGTALHLFPTDEKLVHTDMKINGMQADFYEEHGDEYSCFIVWFDEENQIFFDINSNMTADETIRMAESVQKGMAMELMSRYTCTWLPEGYRARELSWGSHSRLESCMNGNKQIRLEYELLEDQSVEEVFRVDAYSERKAVTVWDQDAELYLNTDDDEHTLIWVEKENGIVFSLEAAESEDTILCVAENIKKE